MEADPFKQFDNWFKNCAAQVDASYEEANAFSLSTTQDNKPSSRMVLLKEYSHHGFIFYTNAVSRKAQQLKNNPYAAMLFYWPCVDRQIRIEGVVEVLEKEAAEAYWAERPLASRIGSKLSHQSSVIPSRQYLEERRVELEKTAESHGEKAISKPDSWLGYILKPDYFEFWQGQTNRVHDRIVYEKEEEDAVGEGKDGSSWALKRLAP